MDTPYLWSFMHITDYESVYHDGSRYRPRSIGRYHVCITWRDVTDILRYVKGCPLKLQIQYSYEFAEAYDRIRKNDDDGAEDGTERDVTEAVEYSKVLKLLFNQDTSNQITELDLAFNSHVLFGDVNNRHGPSVRIPPLPTTTRLSSLRTLEVSGQSVYSKNLQDNVLHTWPR
jgi:hypothetical protein